MERLRSSIVGLGRIGSLLEDDALREKPCTHAGAVAADPDCFLAGGCDSDAGRRRLFARRWACPCVKGDFEDMMALSRPHILHIATPPDTHLDLVRRALPFGVKVLICEKPLAETGAEAQEILDLSRAGRLKLLVNHERRYSRDYLAAREKLAGGMFGRLLSVSARLCFGRSRPAAAVLLHDGTHLLDIIRFLTAADLEAAAAERLRRAGEETLIVSARAGDVPVRIEIGTGRSYVEFELDLSCSEGRLRIGNGLYEEYVSRPSPYYENMRSLVRTPARRPRRTGYFANMLRDAVRCAREDGRQPVSGAADGAAAILFIDAVKALLEAETRHA
jgi:predicted dehydrogenase